MACALHVSPGCALHVPGVHMLLVLCERCRCCACADCPLCAALQMLLAFMFVSFVFGGYSNFNGLTGLVQALVRGRHGPPVLRTALQPCGGSTTVHAV